MGYIKTDDLIDHLIYAGASQYSWWHEVSEDGKTITLAIDDPADDDNDPIEKTVSIGEARRVIASIIKNQKSGWQYIKRAMDDEDFDANDADIVLQYLVLGELTYA